MIEKKAAFEFLGQRAGHVAVVAEQFDAARRRLIDSQAAAECGRPDFAFRIFDDVEDIVTGRSPIAFRRPCARGLAFRDVDAHEAIGCADVCLPAARKND